MAWRDNLQPASFRGIPFYVESADTAGGRRTQVHEYMDAPDGKGVKPFPEDLGAATLTFTIEGYVLGQDYMDARDALFDALNAKGPGQLIHPYKGTLDVQVQGVSYREERERGGYAKFSMSFVESGRREYPTADIDRIAGVDGSALGVRGAAITAFLDKFKVDGLPEFVRTVARADIASISKMLLGVNLPGAATDLLSDYVKAANSLVVNADRLLAEPSALANQVTGLIGQLRGLMASSGTGENPTVFKPLTSFTTTAQSNFTTPSEAQASTNGQVFEDLVRDTAIAEHASAAVRGTYESYDEAVNTRDETLAQIDAQAETSADEVYTAYQTLRAQVVTALPEDAEDLPRLSTIQIPESTPAVVLAYGLYDDTSRDAEIVSRNRIRHPGFVPSNRALQVLSDG